MQAWTTDGVHITHTADHNARVRAYTAVDFGPEHPELLSGNDILGGNLGVSGQQRGSTGVIQEIAGSEALKFHFDTGSVSAFILDFADWTRGDTARIDLLDRSGWTCFRKVESFSDLKGELDDEATTVYAGV